MELRNIFITFILLILISCTSALPSIGYTWLEKSDKYDAIVGISTESIPVCTGVLVNKFSVITAANPIYVVFRWYEGDSPEMYVHAIAGRHDKTVVHHVKRITFQSKRHTMFKPFGFDKQHSPIHDIVILDLFQPMETFTEVVYLERPSRVDGGTTTKREVRFPPYQLRHYSMRPIINVKSFDKYGWFSMAGHGFIDRPHVKQNIDLEVIDYQVEKVMRNCDEWIPRTWGRFICLSNIEKFVGVTAGGPLFYNRRFIGMGAFSLLKGNESILVFTDLREYKGMKSRQGFVQILPDDPRPGYPEEVTPIKNYFYLSQYALAQEKNPVTKEPRYWSFEW